MVIITSIGLLNIYRTCQEINSQLPLKHQKDNWTQYILHVAFLSLTFLVPFLNYLTKFYLLEPITLLMVYTLICVILWRQDKQFLDKNYDYFTVQMPDGSRRL